MKTVTKFSPQGLPHPVQILDEWYHTSGMVIRVPANDPEYTDILETYNFTIITEAL